MPIHIDCHRHPFNGESVRLNRYSDAAVDYGTSWTMLAEGMACLEQSVSPGSSDALLSTDHIGLDRR